MKHLYPRTYTLLPLLSVRRALRIKTEKKKRFTKQSDQSHELISILACKMSDNDFLSIFPIVSSFSEYPLASPVINQHLIDLKQE